MSKASNDRKRMRLHREQGGKCFYCRRIIGILLEHTNEPVLEHYIPQCMKGNKRVLACRWCDSKKGMIPGPEFEEILARHRINAENFNKMQQAAGAECKRRNAELNKNHPPNLAGQQATRNRYIKHQAVVEVVLSEPSPMACESSGIQSS